MACRKATASLSRESWKSPSCRSRTTRSFVALHVNIVSLVSGKKEAEHQGEVGRAAYGIIFVQSFVGIRAHSTRQQEQEVQWKLHDEVSVLGDALTSQN
jgi:glucose-6-phosphate 1-dehydrogenase